MNIIPQDIKLTKFYKYLHYEDIIRLCRTNREFNRICENNSTWEYLLNRDFGVNITEENPRILYILYKTALEHISKYYPIITQRALNIIVSVISQSQWDDFDNAIETQRSESQDPPSILTFRELEDICSIMEKSISKCDKITSMGESSVIYSDFDEMIYEVESLKCENFISIISKPTFIFINKKLILINYDYDLAFDIVTGVDMKYFDICSNKFEDLEKELISMIRLHLGSNIKFISFDEAQRKLLSGEFVDKVISPQYQTIPHTSGNVIMSFFDEDDNIYLTEEIFPPL